MPYLRERWSESDVLSLPAGEQDYFDRKSGRLLDDQHFRRRTSEGPQCFF